MQKLCVRHFFTCSFEILCKGTCFLLFRQIYLSNFRKNCCLAKGFYILLGENLKVWVILQENSWGLKGFVKVGSRKVLDV